MPKLTWLGDAECIWNDVTFPVGVPIDIDDPYMLGKAKHSPYFRVEHYDPFLDRPTQWREPATEADPKDVSFFDDPPGVETPPDYPPEDPPKRKPGRPRNKVSTDGSG